MISARTAEAAEDTINQFSTLVVELQTTPPDAGTVVLHATLDLTLRVPTLFTPLFRPAQALLCGGIATRCISCRNGRRPRRNSIDPLVLFRSTVGVWTFPATFRPGIRRQKGKIPHTTAASYLPHPSPPTCTSPGPIDAACLDRGL